MSRELVDVAITYNRQRLVTKVDRQVIESIFEQRDAEGIDQKGLGIGLRRLLESLLSGRFRAKRPATPAEAPATLEPTGPQKRFARVIEKTLEISAPSEAWTSRQAMNEFIRTHKDSLPERDESTSE